MARKMTEWPSKRGPITKIMPSDGCIGDTVPLAVGKWYDFHEFGWYMGNVGYFKNSLEVRDREAADEVVPIVEVEMISMNANGQFVPPQEAVRVDIYEFGPERRLLRTTHMVRQ